MLRRTLPVLTTTLALALPLTLGVAGCARAPSPLHPHYTGSIGTPSRGVLAEGIELPSEGDGYRWLRKDARHYGIPRFVHALERAASKVRAEREGSVLSVGDLSVRRGGRLLPHFSHRTGRDVDLLLYLTTLDGAPVDSPGFVPVGSDGLARDPKTGRYLRFDVERTWLLVRTLLGDEDARVQWIFVHKNLQAMLLSWAYARGESLVTLMHAAEVMHQPNPGGPHDDHLHVRTACSPEDVANGCEPTGPARAWLTNDPVSAPNDTDETFVAMLSLDPPPSASGSSSETTWTVSSTDDAP